MSMRLKSLPDILFVDASKEAVEALIIGEYEKAANRTLAKGDPVRLFLLVIANIIILLLNKINETGKQNLLRYASGKNLDHLGALVGAERIPASAATTTIKVELSAALGNNATIPAGTRFTAGDNVFFSLDHTMIITAGQLTGQGSATCTQSGSIGNGYLAGQIKTLVDPLPYVKSVSNVTTSEGGADIQDDESYRNNIHEAPESFSVAGPEGAYKYHAKRASSQIVDVAVLSPTPGTVEVRPLLVGGEIPGSELINQVKAALDDKRVRPLTDKVTVLAPTKVEYALNVVIYIDRADETKASAIETAAKKAAEEYVLWQKSRLGRDINPSELIARLMSTGVKRVTVTSPTFTKLTDIQVAICNSSSVNMGGIEDA